MPDSETPIADHPPRSASSSSVWLTPENDPARAEEAETIRTGELTGTRWYVGCNKSGKTSLAKDHLKLLIRRNGWPALILDSQGVDQLADVRHARTMREALEWVWGAGQHAAYVPKNQEEVDALARACLDPGEVNLFVDEAHLWLRARKGADGPLVALIRGHRHAKANLLLTTQHYTADVPQEARSCAPRLHVFRCTGQAVLDELKKLGVDPERAKSLEQNRFVTVYDGF